MSIEAVIYQQDPFRYVYKDYNSHGTAFGGGYLDENALHEDNRRFRRRRVHNAGDWDSSPTAHINTSSSSETTCGGVDGLMLGAGGEVMMCVAPAVEGGVRRKRRREKGVKNREETESKRMTHIAVERNRRRQMNDYLAVLRSLMPPSYAQRGDQASIVGGAIDFVKQLEQLLQFLQAHKFTGPMISSTFFTFPQYSMAHGGGGGEKRSAVADIEVSMAESHANVKILSRNRPKQLLNIVAGLHSLSLTVLHLNITTALDHSVFYSFSLKVEDKCQMTSANEIATAMHEMMQMIQRDGEHTTTT